MKTKKIAYTAAASILLLCGMAQAGNNSADPYSQHQRGWYVGAGVGAEGTLLSDSSNDGSTSYQYHAGPAAQLDVGFQFNRHLAMGVTTEYVSYNHYSIVPVTLYLQGILPVSERFAFTGQVGIGVQFITGNEDHAYQGSVNNRDCFPMAGIGAKYRITPAVDLGVNVNVKSPFGESLSYNLNHMFDGGYASLIQPSAIASVTYHF